MANQLSRRLKYSISGKNSNFKTIEDELQFSNKNFKCAKQRRVDDDMASKCIYAAVTITNFYCAKK